MLGRWILGWRTCCVGACAAMIAVAGVGRAGDDADLRKLLEEQAKQIQELKQRLDATEQNVNAQDADKAAPGDAAVRKIVGVVLD